MSLVRDGTIDVMQRAVILVLAIAAFGGSAASAVSVSTATHPANVVTVGCDQIIGTAKTGHDSGYRVVLGVVSAPPASLQDPVYVADFAPFPYWLKAGMVIRAGSRPVTVSVPEAWRRRERIGWGNPATPTTVVRFAACPSLARTWNAYSGGFFLRTRAACVPLRFAVGERSAKMRFGLGRHC